MFTKYIIIFLKSRTEFRGPTMVLRYKDMREKERKREREKERKRDTEIERWREREIEK